MLTRKSPYDSTLKTEAVGSPKRLGILPGYIPQDSTRQSHRRFEPQTQLSVCSIRLSFLTTLSIDAPVSNLRATCELKRAKRQRPRHNFNVIQIVNKNLKKISLQR
jgi:hypothetical protein